MMTVSAMSGGQGSYYLNLAKEDYYLEGGEPPGTWYGSGAKGLGLEADSRVDKEAFRHLFSGFDHSTGADPLVQNAGKDNRQPGWDLTFSAPKSVSVMWSQAGKETRLEIQAAQQEAAQKALDYLQEKAAFTRTGKGGAEREQAGLVVATFEHGTSRAQDPQIHTHALVLNVGMREDGQTATVESYPFYLHAKAAGAVYRAELAHQLQGRLGLLAEARAEGWGFEIQGVDRTLMEACSKRREAIEKKLSELGFGSAKAAELANLETRFPKEHKARSALFAEWRQLGAEHGWSTREAEALCTMTRDLREHQQQVREELCRGVGETLVEKNSTFLERDVVALVADRASHHGLGAQEALAAVEHYLKSSPIIKDLGTWRGQERIYTTRELYDLEAKMVAGLQASKDEPTQATLTAHRVTVAVKAIEKQQGFALNEEQRRAVTHLTVESGGVACVTGMAGTGKTTMLKTAREAWERDGFRVRGATIAGKAAEGLEAETGMTATSIAKLLYDLDRSKERFSLSKALADFKEYRRKQINEGHLSWVATNFDPTLARKWFYEYRPENPLKKCEVLVVDEAAMVDTRQMARLVEETRKRGIKLVLVGDDRQLQAIGPGGAFMAAVEILGSETLKNIHRQREEWARKAVHDFADRKAQDGLDAYKAHGQLKISKNREQARIDLIKAWKADGHEKTPEKAIILAAMRDEVQKLNWDAQSVRRREGQLGSGSIKIGSYDIHKNDRVVFTRRLIYESSKAGKKLSVQNGQFGQVHAIHTAKGTVSVRLDNGRKVEVAVKAFQNLELGYASTTHKAQGSTIDQVYVLAGGQMQDREMSYVQMSRGREHTKIFVDRQNAGKEMKELAESMQRNHQKELAMMKAGELMKEDGAAKQLAEEARCRMEAQRALEAQRAQQHQIGMTN